MPNLLRRLAAVSLVLALSGCAVKFVEDYDVVLDQGLSDYQGEMAAFMARMAALSGAPEGKYEAPDVQAFYARTSAELQTFVERAEAIDSSGLSRTRHQSRGRAQRRFHRRAGVASG